jgi:signal transduction histidine kinase
MGDVKILVVEDESIVAKDIERCLKNLGYTVSATVVSGEEAIKKAGEDKPDLVLMDIVLQGEMDGIEAAKQIRSRFNIPIIYLTAYADEAILERAKITEPFGYILKPFEDRELHIIIEIAVYRHKMEMKLKETEAQLIQSAKMKAIGELAKGVAHEFNNLITGIKGYAELARLKEGDQKTISKALDVILRASDRAHELTTKLLTFSQHTESLVQWTNIENLINDVLTLVGKQMEKGNIQIVRNFDSLLPVKADAIKLQQVFLNLLINACEAMPNGGTLIVSTRSKSDKVMDSETPEKYVTISFQDTGCGIPPENLDRIFEPFFTTKGALGGSSIPGIGLGLSLAYSYIRDHNGTIEVESKVGKGSNFIITLPIDSG